MDSTDQFHRSPLLDENSLQENTTEYTGDGSICTRGHPASKKRTGKWEACSFALVCSFCSYLAYSSIAKNLVSYLTKVLHQTNVVAARNVSTWQGTSYLAPLVGAFIADSYLGKYWTALISFTILIIGMMILVLSATLPLISTTLVALPAWTDTDSSQYIIFFVGLYMVAVGYGAQSPCVTSFGADQFDDTDEEEKTKKSSFFNWNHFIVNAGALISGTIIVWIQDHKGQVSAIEGSRKLEHTTGLEFFDKAAIVTSSNCESVDLLNKWRICTVTQVEELKILVRMLPIWATGVLFSTVLTQMFSTFIEQGMVMDQHIGYFEIPPASFQSVEVLTILALVPTYERILVPLLRKFTGTMNGITPLQRIGVGLFFSTLSMLSAALVESNRLQIAQDKGLVHQKVVVPMSILWQGPQYFMVGASEVFSLIGLSEFFYEESPDAMRSLCVSFYLANISAGGYVSSFIISLVPVFTAGGGTPGWIPDNLNEGHLDRFFWMMAGLCSLNLVAFVFCSMRYKSKKAS